MQISKIMFQTIVSVIIGLIVLVFILAISLCKTEKKVQELEKKLETTTSQPSVDYHTQPPCAGC